MKLNTEELAVGFSAGAAFVGFLGPLVILTAPISAIFWALGGAGHKAWRRLGVPATICLFAGFLMEPKWAALAALPLAIAACSVGYGIPTRDSNGLIVDGGSAIGAWVWRHIGENDALAQAATRTICGALFGLAFLPIGAVRGMAAWGWGFVACAVLFPVAAWAFDGEIEI